MCLAFDVAAKINVLVSFDTINGPKSINFNTKLALLSVISVGRTRFDAGTKSRLQKLVFLGKNCKYLSRRKVTIKPRIEICFSIFHRHALRAFFPHRN